VYDVGGDGSLTLVSIPACGGNWPRNFALAPGGQFLLVANQYSNEICVLPMLEGMEALGAPVARATVAGASCIQFV
jgi:6-phosphogluconolactonase